MDKRTELVAANRSPPYSIRAMQSPGQQIWHIVGVDGFSIIATCYDEAEARLLAAAPEMREELSNWQPEGSV